MIHYSRIAMGIIVLAAITSKVPAMDSTLKQGATIITYEGISEKYAEAIAKTVESARTIAKDKLGYAMPANIRVKVKVDPTGQTRLFNDGADFFSLTVRSERDLKKPVESGIFHLYGLCHEVAHLAMYLPIKDRGWLTTAAAEGWAHYLGSRLVDEVYKQQGPDLWPDKYDYAEDGTKRLARQIAREDRGLPTVRGAALWQQLGTILDDQQIAELFAAWGNSQIEPTKPQEALEARLAETPKREACLAWWKSANPVFASTRSASGFATKTATPEELTGKATELSADDEEPAGKQSTADSGHAVGFETADDSFYLTAIKIHGARYGSPQAPKEDFVLTLCDENFEVISSFKLPYSKFSFGEMKWVKLEVKPTLVPKNFAVFVEFNPTQRKGVFVSHDGAVNHKSYSGLPGKKPRPATKGDWLIRAEVDQLKSTDALRDPQQGSP
jgi:hypothetical protein